MHARRFLLGFVAVGVAGELLYFQAQQGQAWFLGYLRCIARLLGVLLHVGGAGVEVVGNSVHTTRFAISIVAGCEAGEPMLLLTAAMLAMPRSWRWRASGVALGLVLLFGINLIRLLSLLWCGSVRPEWFDVLHLGVWEPAMLLLTFGWFLLWTKRAPRWADGYA